MGVTSAGSRGGEGRGGGRAEPSAPREAPGGQGAASQPGSAWKGASTKHRGLAGRGHAARPRSPATPAPPARPVTVWGAAWHREPPRNVCDRPTCSGARLPSSPLRGVGVLGPREGQLVLSRAPSPPLATAGTLPHRGRGRLPVGAPRKEESDARASRHRVTVPRASPRAGSQKRGEQLQGQNAPRKSTRAPQCQAAGDTCQTIGQQGAPCLRDPANPS